ncbi:hypothetical protein V1522DRAFT_461133 [Lipomyces starkeyi]
MTQFLNFYTISIFVALGGVLFGFEIASIIFNNPLGIQQGVITSAIACGSFVGSISSSFLAARLSRKLAIQLGAIVWCIGACLQSAAYGVVMLIIGPAIAGLCIGITSTVVPIYQSEIAPQKIRGQVVSLQNCALGFGLLVQYFIQYGCSFINSTAAFRVPWAIQTIPAIILFIILFWLPRSARWLASRDHWIYAERESNSNSYRKLHGDSSVHANMYFIVNILQSVGRPNSLLTSSILYVMGLLATIPVMIWTDRWGRRGLFATFGEKNPAANEPYTWIIVGRPGISGFVQASMYLFVLSYALSWGPVSWIYPPEIMPQLVRAKGVALATATNWAFNAAMGVAVPPLWRAITWRLFIISEMDGVFEHGEPLWRSFGKGANCDRLDTLAREIELTEQRDRGLHPRN